MFYIYILKSTLSGRYYIGCTGNIAQRLKFHNNGLVKSTKPFAPWELVYHEGLDSLQKARARELQLKSWEKRAALERLIISRGHSLVAK